MATPGRGPPRPLMVPVTEHVAAVGGACCAPTPAVSAKMPMPASTAAAATRLRAVLDSAGIRVPFMSLLLPDEVAPRGYVAGGSVPMTKACQRPPPHVFLLSLLVLNVSAPSPIPGIIRRSGWGACREGTDRQ